MSQRCIGCMSWLLLVHCSRLGMGCILGNWVWKKHLLGKCCSWKQILLRIRLRCIGCMKMLFRLSIHRASTGCTRGWQAVSMCLEGIRCSWYLLILTYIQLGMVCRLMPLLRIPFLLCMECTPLHLGCCMSRLDIEYTCLQLNWSRFRSSIPCNPAPVRTSVIFHIYLAMIITLWNYVGSGHCPYGM